jgi:hypothetical protein
MSNTMLSLPDLLAASQDMKRRRMMDRTRRAEGYKTFGASVSDRHSVSSPIGQAQAASKDQRRQKQSAPTMTAAMPSGATTAAVSR